MTKKQEQPTKLYEPSDYKNKSEVSQGLAITHEQATDTLTEGTIDGVMEDVNGRDIPLQELQDKKNS